MPQFIRGIYCKLYNPFVFHCLDFLNPAGGKVFLKRRQKAEGLSFERRGLSLTVTKFAEAERDIKR